MSKKNADIVELSPEATKLAQLEKLLQDDRGAGALTLSIDHRTGRIQAAVANITSREALQIVRAVQPELERAALDEEVQERVAAALEKKEEA